MKYTVAMAKHANRILRGLGVRVVRAESPADRRRKRLMALHRISAVIDIGANEGQYGLLLRNLGYQGVIHSYEPLAAPFKKLQKTCAGAAPWVAHNEAVSSVLGDVTMNVAANSVSSSLLPMTARHVAAAPQSTIVAQERTEAVSLEQVLREVDGSRTMVKVDTQGHELQVLESAGPLLAGISILELEVSLVELYRGQALFRDLDGFLLLNGFRLVSLEDGFFDVDSGELLQMDAIYVREVDSAGSHVTRDVSDG